MMIRVLQVFGALAPYFVYLHYFGSINSYFQQQLGIGTGLDVNASMAILRALDVLRMLVFNEGLIVLAVLGIYGCQKAVLYMKFSAVFICVALMFKALTYFTHWDLLQKIAYSMSLLGSNIEWLLLVLASFYVIKKAPNIEAFK
jgi:hypothetical protein